MGAEPGPAGGRAGPQQASRTPSGPVLLWASVSLQQATRGPSQASRVPTLRCGVSSNKDSSGDRAPDTRQGGPPEAGRSSKGAQGAGAMAAAVASLAWWGGGGRSRGGGRTYLLATASAQGKPPCHLTSAPGARPSPLPPPCSRLALLSLSLMAPSAPWPPPTHLPPSRKLPVPRPPLHCAQGSFSGPCGPARSPALPSEGVPHTASPTERLRAARRTLRGLRGLTGKPPAGPPTDLGGRLLLGPPPGLYAERRRC